MNYTVHGILQARILEWVAFPFSRGSSQPRDRTQTSRIAGRFFTSWATREAQEYWSGQPIPSPWDLPDSGIEPVSPALQADSLPTQLWGKPRRWELQSFFFSVSIYLFFLPGKSHGQGRLVGYSPWGHKELGTAEHVYLFSSIRSAIGLVAVGHRLSICSVRA